MKKSMLIVLVLVVASLTLINVSAAAEKSMEKAVAETATGKVTSVDPEGKAIMISVKVGKDILNVGTIINKETTVKVKGKRATLDEIKNGDTVTIRYLRSDDLYAKEIEKK